MKAQSVFDKQKTVIKESVDARKQPIADDDAWKLLKGADEIIVGKGKKQLRFTPDATAKQEILDNCLGRTGNLRAPTLKIGKKIIVGFNEEMYATYIDK